MAELPLHCRPVLQTGTSQTDPSYSTTHSSGSSSRFSDRFSPAQQRQREVHPNEGGREPSRTKCSCRDVCENALAPQPHNQPLGRGAAATLPLLLSPWATETEL